MLNEALKYAKQGLHVFPVKAGDKIPLTAHGVKDASCDPEQVKTWWENWPTANIGMACGPSGIVAVDLDERHEGIDNWHELCGKMGIDDDTVTSLTGGGGMHLLFRAPEGVDIKNSAGVIAPGVDIKTNGGYIVLPPSIHPNGKTYQWEVTNHIESVPLKPFPQALLELLQPRQSAAPVIHEERVFSEGERNDALFKMACSMRRKGMSETSIRQALQSENRVRCSPPLLEGEVIRIAESAGRYQPTEDPAPKEEFNITDLGNAKRLVATYGQDLLYCHTFEKWYVWDGGKWIQDNRGEIHQYAHKTVREIAQEALTIPNETERKERVKKALASESHSRIIGMISEAQSLLPILPTDFDQSPMLLNCPNGTVDLKTGQLREHNRTNYLSRSCAIPYDPQAPCPRWESFLFEVMQGSAELVQFVKKAVGYALTGDNSEQCLFIFYGTGANGKSTFLNTVLNILGDYSTQTPTETLMVKRDNGIPSDLARLLGVRMVAAAETDEGKRISESLVKQLTGGDRIPARHLYGHWFEFTPVFKIFLSTNHKPVIRGTDNAIWRRIRLVPFEYTVPPLKRDKHLAMKLQDEAPGILRWAVEGALSWQKEGLEPPQRVIDATAGYRDEMDILGAFMGQCCVQGSFVQAPAGDLYQHYKQWCEETGERPVTSTLFGRLLVERGFQKSRETTGRKRTLYMGIGIAATVEQYLHD